MGSGFFCLARAAGAPMFSVHQFLWFTGAVALLRIWRMGDNTEQLARNMRQLKAAILTHDVPTWEGFRVANSTNSDSCDAVIPDPQRRLLVDVDEHTEQMLVRFCGSGLQPAQAHTVLLELRA